MSTTAATVVTGKVGRLALESGERLPLRVCRSAAGYYIGTYDDEGPYTRESAEYWKTQEAAAKALETGNWTQRDTL